MCLESLERLLFLCISNGLDSQYYNRIGGTKIDNVIKLFHCYGHVQLDQDNGAGMIDIYILWL